MSELIFSSLKVLGLILYGGYLIGISKNSYRVVTNRKNYNVWLVIGFIGLLCFAVGTTTNVANLVHAFDTMRR